MPLKRWKKPLLTILVRVRPEEHILSSCKNAGGDISGPSTDAGYCFNSDPGCIDIRCEIEGDS